VRRPTTMTRRSQRLMLGFALAGLAASAVASWVHWQLIARPGYTSFCDINATVSCTDAYLSRYGSFAGIPVALGGVFWFSFVAILLVAGGRAVGTFRENVPGYVFALSTLALAAVLYLAYASFLVLKSFCILCIITYASVAGIFVVSGGATSFPMTTLPGRTLRDLRSLIATPAALFVALIFVAGAGTTVALFPHEASGGDDSAQAAPQQIITDDVRSEFERWFLAQPRVKVPVDAEGAKVLIVKFNDYQCPPCRQTYMEYKSVLAKYEASDPNAVRFVTKDYPLEPECNFNVGRELHPAACEAAAAVRLAREKGKVHEMEEWLFGNQARLAQNPNAVPAIRDAVGRIAGVQDFDARYARTLKDVQVDISLGGTLQVTSTPTFFINGRKIGGLPAQLFDHAIRLALKDPPQ
jgi:uncharacterized membrane protein/protein-disulfide isomerase